MKSFEESLRAAEEAHPFDKDAQWRMVMESEEPAESPPIDLPSEAELDRMYEAWAHSMASGDHPIDPRD